MQTYTWQGATFDGEVLDGFRHGYGRLTVAEGSSVMYEGLWQHGKRHGPGGVLYYNADKTAYYQGAVGPDRPCRSVLLRPALSASQWQLSSLGRLAARLGLLMPGTASLTAAGPSGAFLALPCR